MSREAVVAATPTLKISDREKKKKVSICYVGRLNRSGEAHRLC